MPSPIADLSLALALSAAMLDACLASWVQAVRAVQAEVARIDSRVYTGAIAREEPHEEASPDGTAP